MFTGEYRHSVDDKGRIAVPAKFRAQLAEGDGILDDDGKHRHRRSDPDAGDDNSIYRYDRAALLAALKSAAGGGKG